MFEGLWIVQYEGTAGGDGGVIVLVQGRVLGGDNAYVYTGSYQGDGENYRLVCSSATTTRQLGTCSALREISN